MALPADTVGKLYAGIQRIESLADVRELSALSALPAA